MKIKELNEFITRNHLENYDICYWTRNGKLFSLSDKAIDVDHAYREIYIGYSERG